MYFFFWNFSGMYAGGTLPPMQGGAGLRRSGPGTRYAHSPTSFQKYFRLRNRHSSTKDFVYEVVRLRKFVYERFSMTSTEWNKSRDAITIRPEKKIGEEIRAAAKADGLSVQAFILKAVQYQIKTKGCYKVAYPKEIVDALAKSAKVKPSEFLRQLSPLQGDGGAKTTGSPKKK